MQIVSLLGINYFSHQCHNKQNNFEQNDVIGGPGVPGRWAASFQLVVGPGSGRH